jgi:hypothetical protein
MTDTAVRQVTIASAIHGPRVFTRIGVRQHVCRDGRAVRLAIWETPCVVCGVAFEASTPRNVISDMGSRALTKITCKSHRLTAAEASFPRLQIALMPTLAEDWLRSRRHW